MKGRKLKIAIVGATYPFRGGIASFCHRLGEEFRADGHDVQLITFTCQYPSFLFPGNSQFNDGPNPTTLPIHRKIHSINPLSWWITGQWMKKQKYDLIICKFWMPFFGPSFGSIFRLAKHNKTTSVLCIVDNIIPHERRFFDIPFAHYFVPSIDLFIVMSISVREDLKRFARNQPVSMVRHPIYDNYGELASKRESCTKLALNPNFKYLLFFGFIRPYKGLDLLIAALDGDYFKKNKIRLIIAGEYYSDADVYKRQIQNLKHPEVILEHTTFIADDDVRYYFGVADLVVQPYKSATQSGISQLSIYFEKPMIVTDVGGLKEIIGDEKGGYVVSPDPVEIRQAIQRYFNKTDQLEMTHYIRALKRKYSWAKLSDEILRLTREANWYE